MTIYLRRENARRDALAAQEGKRPEDYTEEEKDLQREMGDNATVCFLFRVLTLCSLINNPFSSSATPSNFILDSLLHFGWDR